MKNSNKKRYDHIPLSKDFNNWWYFGRKKILNYIISKKKYNKPIKILEIGPGVGVNIEVLQEYGIVDILEVDEYFIEIIKKNKKLNVGKIFYDFSEIKEQYDLIVFLDVLEHIYDYEGFLLNVNKLMKDDGIGVLSVPAYQTLFSQHDTNLHHYRRYNWELLKEQTLENFEIVNRFGYNYILLPVRFLQIKILKSVVSDTTVSNLINKILKSFIKLEVFLLRIKLNIKVGLSLFAVLKKK